MTDRSPPLRAVRIEAKCPICGKPADPKYKPFCRKRCADIDLGRAEDHGVKPVDDRATQMGACIGGRRHRLMPRIGLVGPHRPQVEALDVEQRPKQAGIQHVNVKACDPA